MARKLVPLAENYKIEIDEDVFNKTYLPYLYSINRWETYFGGSASGKSFFITQKLALQLTMLEGRNLIALRHQDKDCRDSCYPQLLKALEQLNLLQFWQVKEFPSPRLINRINGNEIAFTGLDDVENVKSVTFKKGNVTDFWVEEANEIESVKDLRELNRRLRGAGPKKRIIVSFNPVSRTHWLYNFVYSELKTKDALVLKTTYKDNKFLSVEDVNELEALQYISPYEYMVYALGEWGTMGDSVFNANGIHARLVELSHKHDKHPPQRIEFSFERDDNGLPNKDSFKPFNNDDGETVIFKDVEPRHPYVFAIDPAEGGNDYYSGQMIDNLTGEQVATYHSQQNEEHSVLQCYALGKYYNDALVCPESNVGSYTIKTFVALDYPNIYQRVTAIDNMHRTSEQKMGFRTTAENRKQILTDLQTWANANYALLNDPETLNEMLTFTRQQKKLKGIWWGAESGAHDDLVMSLAIALQAREQQESSIQPERVKKDGFYFKGEIESMIQDKIITRAEAREFEKMDRVIGAKSAERVPNGRRSRYVR